MMRPALLSFAVMLVLGAGGCGARSAPGEPQSRVDEGLGTGTDVRRVPAFRETRPVRHRGDAADDPALWIHPDDPAQSTVIGTDKRGGLAVYDLHGEELQYLPVGQPNNVDVRDGVRVGGRPVTIVAAEDREHDEILLFRVDPVTRRLHPVAARRLRVGMTVYGSCMYRSAVSGRSYVFVSSKEGRLRQFQLLPRPDDRVDAKPVRSLDVGGRAEGCVADDATGTLYVSEENRGVWRYHAEPGASRQRTLVDHTGRRGHLTADVEGLALAELGGGRRYLLASNQGEDSFTVYRRGGVDEYLATFRVVGGSQADGVRGTDGIAATTRPLGRDFPTGLVVVQDGDNRPANQNFKLVWWDLAAILGEADR